MKILAIETSCDETAVALIDARGSLERMTIEVEGNALLSQAPLHAAFGGVYPSLAKREHQGNLVPLAIQALQEAGALSSRIETLQVPDKVLEGLRDIPFQNTVKTFLETYESPKIDMIAVTRGPGLEPALWTGITFAEALGNTWNTPVYGIDHMEGHMLSALLKTDKKNRYSLKEFELPLLTLLISGGHTELILMKKWFSFTHIGETRDDAVGEAFDKVARLLDLSYPGGPKIAEFAAKARKRGGTGLSFPRPMAHDATCDFSFSGLKTAVMYKLRAMDKISETDKEEVALAFEDAVRDIIVIKTRLALQESMPLTLAVAGGVSANEHVRQGLERLRETEFPNVRLTFPEKELTGDNAIMIGATAFARSLVGGQSTQKLVASGNLRRTSLHH